MFQEVQESLMVYVTGSDGELELSWEEGCTEGGNRGLGYVYVGTFDLGPR